VLSSWYAGGLHIIRNTRANAKKRCESITWKSASAQAVARLADSAGKRRDAATNAPHKRASD
jgi:hypothetical protein